MRLPDTLHCANISIISKASCNKDYPGRVLPTMVCAGVEGGGTDSCEVRAKWRLWVKAPARARVGGGGMESNLSLVPSVGLDSASHSWGPGLALLGCVESE